MINELLGPDKRQILPLITNTNNELSIWSVVSDLLPGEVWVDQDNPTYGLVKTPECNVLFGVPSDTQTCAELFEKIGYFGTVTCDNSSWNTITEKCHKNSAIRKYTRQYFSIRREELIRSPSREVPQILHLSDLKKIQYTNRAIVLDWINLQNQSEQEDFAVAAVIVKENMIVSCAAVDCVHQQRAEIGIKTVEDFRRQGYGLASVTALLGALFDHGIREIGWHCVRSNKGSIAIAKTVGFLLGKEYESYAPFPPIENTTDLDETGWIEYARFFEDKAEHDANHYWQAAKCWAKALDISGSIECITMMIDRNILWFKDYIDESAEFSRFYHTPEWVALMEKIT